MVPIFNLTHKLEKRCKRTRLKFTLSSILLVFTGLTLSFTHTFGQDIHHLPEVHNEPRHEVIWENEDFRFLKVYILPGDSSLMHAHSSPIAYVSVRESCVYIDYNDGNSKEVTLPYGWTGYDFYNSNSPFVHSIAPCNQDTLHVYALQAKNHSAYARQEKESAFGFAPILVSSDSVVSKRFDLPIIFKSGPIKLNNRAINSGEYILPSDFDKIQIDGESEFWYPLIRK